MMYSTTHCHFCKDHMQLDERSAGHIVSCQNSKCKHGYHVEFNSGYGTLVCFDVAEYVFTISDSPTETIIEQGDSYFKEYECYRVNEELLVTADNYLQVVDRLKKLQAFK